MEKDLQARYGKLSDFCSNIDDLLAKTSLGAGQAKQSSDSSRKRLDELYVPLPELVDLSKVLHQPNQSQQETEAETKQVDRAIELVDKKLEERRLELGLQLEMLGFSNWKKDLETLQQKDKSKNVEDLISEVYQKYFTNSEINLSLIKNEKFGGAISNLKSSIKELDEIGWTGWAFSAFTGHSGALKEQIEAEKKMIQNRLKTIMEFSQELKGSRLEIAEAKTNDTTRDKLVAEAQAAFRSGNQELAQQLSNKADLLIDSIKTRLLRADERLSHKHSVDYEAQMAELRKMQKKWESVDQSYGKTIAWMDSISRGAMMAVAVGAGILLLPVGLSAGMAFLASFAITTGVGFGLALARNAAYTVFGGADKFSWSDVGKTTFETGLMGLGGGMMAGLKVAFGAGAAATRIAIGAGWGTRALNFARAAAGSGGTAVGTSLPSSAYHFGEEFLNHRSMVREMLNDDKLSREEYEWLENNKMIPYAMEKGIVRLVEKDSAGIPGFISSSKRETEVVPGDVVVFNPRTNQTTIVKKSDIGKVNIDGEIVGFKLSDQDKKDLELTLLGHKAYHLSWVYGLDMSMNFICGVGGHWMSGVRNSNLSKMIPKPAVAGEISNTLATRAVLTKGAAGVSNLSTHALELATSKFAADLNIEAREKYLGEKASEEDRIRAYGQALSGQIIGNIQGDMQARQQRMSELYVDHAQKHADQVASVDAKKAGVKIEELKPFDVETLVGKKATVGDMQQLEPALPMWNADRYAAQQDANSGSPRAKYNKQARESFDQTLKHNNEQTGYPEDFKTKFGGTLKKSAEVGEDRQARITVEGDIKDSRVAKAQLEQYEQHIKQLQAEAEFNSNRYLRGDGIDSNGPVSKFIEGWKATFQKAKSFVSDTTGLLLDVPFVRPLADGASNLFSIASSPFKKTWSLVSDSLIGDAFRVPFHLAKNHFFDKVVYKLLINYSAFNSATALHGPAGLAAFWTVSIAVMDKVGFTMGRKLGINKPRPIDAATALGSKMQIEHTLMRAKEITDLHPELSLRPKTLEGLGKTFKKVDTVFAECTQPRRAGMFLVTALLPLAETPLFKPVVALYSGIKAFGKIPTAFAVTALVGHTLPWIGAYSGPVGWTGLAGYYVFKGLAKFGPSSLRVAIADGCTRFGNALGSDGIISRSLRGETAFHEWGTVAAPFAIGALAISGVGIPYCFAPLLIPFQKTAVGALFKGLSHSSLKAADMMTPGEYKVPKEARFNDGMLAEIEYGYRKTLAHASGLSHIKMIKALEDQLVHDFTNNRTTLESFAQRLDVLVRETDPRIRDQILYRLATVGDVHPKIADAMKHDYRPDAERQVREYEAKNGALTDAERQQKILDCEAGLKKRAVKKARDTIEKREEALAKMTPEKRAQAVAKQKKIEAERERKRKEPFGPEASANLYAGNREPHRYPIDDAKLELLKKVIEDRNGTVDDNAYCKKALETLKPVRGEKPTNTYDVFTSRAKSQFDSEIKGMIQVVKKRKDRHGNEEEVIGTTRVDIERVMDLIKARESYDSYASIRQQIIGKDAKPAKGKRPARRGRDGYLEDIKKQVQECEAHSDPAVKARAAELKELAHTLNEYVYRRERVVDILMGKTPKMEALDFYSKEVPWYIKARKGYKKSVTKDDDGKRIEVRKMSEDQEKMSREKQRKIIEALQVELNRDSTNTKKLRPGERPLTHDEKVEMLNWALKEIDGGKKDLIERRIKAELNNPGSVSPRFATTFWQNAKRRNLAYEATQGLRKGEDKIDVDKRATELITRIKNIAEGKPIDPSSVDPIKQLDQPGHGKKHSFAGHSFLVGLFETFTVKYLPIPLNPWPLINGVKGLTFGWVGPGRTRLAASRSAKMGITSVADVNKVVGELKANPNHPNDGLTLKMRRLAVTMADKSQPLSTRLEAETSLKSLLSEDLDRVKSHFRAAEKKREAAYTEIKKAHENAFKVMSAMEVNSGRYNEIVGVVRNNITFNTTPPGLLAKLYSVVFNVPPSYHRTGIAFQWTPGNQWGTLYKAFRYTFHWLVPVKKPPVVLDNSAFATARPTIWGDNSNDGSQKRILDIESDDYHRFSWEDRLPTKPEKNRFLDMSLKPADEKAYGKGWHKFAGPIDQQYVGLYGDSWIVRTPMWSWVRRRLGYPV